jgi:hypothetical protein
MPPFTPSYRDGQSAASLIIALAKDKPYDYIISYEEIAEQLGIEADDLMRIRSAAARAKPRLLREHLRAIEAVPRKGYRILPPGENAGLATRHRKKSDRQVKRAIAVIKGANERDMTDSERERNRRVGMALSLLHERQIDTENRVARLEALMLGKHKPTVIPGAIVSPLAIEAADEAGADSPAGETEGQS